MNVSESLTLTFKGYQILSLFFFQEKWELPTQRKAIKSEYETLEKNASLVTESDLSI